MPFHLSEAVDHLLDHQGLHPQDLKDHLDLVVQEDLVDPKKDHKDLMDHLLSAVQDLMDNLEAEVVVAEGGGEEEVDQTVPSEVALTWASGEEVGQEEAEEDLEDLQV